MSVNDPGSPAAESPREQLTRLLRERAAAPRRRPASFAQRRLWLLDRIQPGSAAYNMPFGFELRGRLDVAALEQSLALLAARHEALRSTLAASGDDDVVQVVKPAPDWRLRAVSREGPDTAEARRALADDAWAPFDLSRGPLARALLVRRAPDEHWLLLTIHHAMCDGWSIARLTTELAEAYAGHVSGRPPALPPVPAQYGDFAAWQRRALDDDHARAHLAYWTRALEGLVPIDLPLDRRRPAVASPRAGRVDVSIDPGTARRVAELARACQATPFMVLLAAWQAVLGRYGATADVSVATPTAGRGRVELEPIVGFFVNTLVLRTSLADAPSFVDLVARVRATVLDAFAHEDVPFERIVEALNPDRSRPPLAQVAFAYQTLPEQTPPPLPGLTVSRLRPDGLTTRFEIECHLWSDGEGLSGFVAYRDDLFDRRTIARLCDAFRHALARAVADPRACIDGLVVLAGEQEAEVLETWGANRIEVSDQSIAARVAARAAEAPEAVAVESAAGRLSYAELEARATGLARALVAAGVGPEAVVAVRVDRGPDLVIGLLAVWKAGGAYLPIDPEYPEARVREMLADSGARVLVGPAGATAPEGVVLVPVTATRASGKLPAPRGGDRLAYVMYTSGSTGAPKGIGVPHAAIDRLVRQPDYATLGPGVRVAQGGPAAFDASTFEFWGPLAHGGTVVVVPREVLLDPESLGAFLRSARITTMFATTALFNAVTNAAPDTWRTLDEVLMGGEAIDPSTVQAALDAGPPGRLHHVYGPTETTTFATWSVLDAVSPEARTLPIGRPVLGTTAYVLDRALRPLPPGAPGELCLGGPGVARGYRGRPGATAERFVPDPFGPPGARLYRTGDCVRWDADGRLEFIGRTDQQVKIRGHRIEPGEIEAALRAESGVREARVLALDGPTGKTLVAYVVGTGFDGRALRDRLRARLPAYLVPEAVVALPALPLTPNGKLDRARLPRPAELDRSAAAPVWSPTEEIVAGVWADVLARAPAARDDDFFELGGHSLLATQVAGRLTDAFGLHVPLRAVFEAPTLGALAGVVDDAVRAARGVKAPPLTTEARTDPLPLSFAQQRLWFLDRVAPGNPAYNVPAAFGLEGTLDVGALARSLDAIVARHEALRTTFAERDGEPHQVIAPEARWPLPVHDLSRLPRDDAEAEAASRVRAFAEQPFDLAVGPLYRAELIRLGPRDHVLALVLHHIVADGWSIGVLSRELAAHYAAFAKGAAASPLPAIDVQYADVAAWQRRLLDGGVLHRQAAYWARQLGGAPTLGLPTDRPRPARQTYRGATRAVRIDADAIAGLDRLSRETGATLFMTLLAAFQALWVRYTGQTDVVVGSPIANRTRAQTEALIGFFVNMLPIRTDAGGDPTMRELAARVRQTALDAYAHQDVPFEMLVDALRPARDMSRPPFFQVTFALHNAPAEALELPGLALRPVPSDLAWVRFDLECHLWRTANGAEGFWAWNVDLFDESTIDRFIRHFLEVVAAMAREPECRLSRLPLSGSAEIREKASAPEDERSSLADLVERQVAATPDAVAVEDARERLTYAALDRRAAGLAAALRACGVGADETVAILMDRSVAMAVGLFAAIKAGGAYLPLDPAHPDSRLHEMIENARPRAVVADRAHAARVPAGVKVLVPDGIAAGDTAPAPRRVRPGSAAYLISTSGSTGRPKTIVIPHAAIVNHMRWMQRAYPLTPADAVLQKTTYTFDAAVWEFWAPLMAGARLVMARPGGHADPAYLVDAIARHRITTLQLVPSVLRVLLDEPGLERCRSLRRVFVGGEALGWDLVAALRARLDVAIVNLYGPAETAIDAVVATCGGEPVGATAPIGWAIDGMHARVLDADLRPTPTGVTGELFLSGAGLARGYLGRPGLTAERFVPDPFAAVPGTRMYRTGDGVRRLAGGALEFVGRLDAQIKIRGFRIEPGEIEAVLREHPLVNGAVVVAHEDRQGNLQLAAHVIPAADQGHATLESEQLQAWHAVYEDTYGEPAGSDDAGLDFVGWTSSYTGKPIPAREMTRWRASTVARIEALGARRVLEIGCGTGLLLFALAPRTERYVGTDFSAPVVARVAAEAAARGLKQVEVACRQADQLDGFDDGAFDVVVINSVAQYFPSVAYFQRVVAGAIRATRPGGKIFLGDLRSLPLLRTFHASIEATRATPDATREIVRARVATRAAGEEELVLDPAIFTALESGEPRLQTVEILLKRDPDDNELSAFRYDVVIGLDTPPSATPVTPIDPAAARDAVAARALERILTETVDAVAIRGLANPRLARWRRIDAWLDDEADETGLAALRRAAPDPGDPDPGEWFAWADARGWSAHVSWSAEDPGKYDVVLTRGTDGPHHGETAGPVRPIGALANDPLAGRRRRALVAALRRDLETRLPSYMVPASIQLLDRLPLTPHGKVDRRALPPPETLQESGGVGSRTMLELRAVQAWEDVLALSPVGVTDNFFDLGGHSLLAVQLAQRLSDSFGVPVPVAAIFEAPTPAAFAARQTGVASPRDGCVVPLQPRGAKTPFFCVHPMSGTPLAYLTLVRELGGDQPFYGLQAPGIEDAAEPVDRIDRLARAYLESVRRVQPSGPYRVGGWSFGGIVAFEMARQLRAAGEDVDLLVLFDAAPWGAFGGDELLADEDALSFAARTLNVAIAPAGAASDEARLRELLEAGQRAGLLPEWVREPQMRRFVRVLRALQTAYRGYRPSPYDGELVLVRADHNPEWQDHDPEAIWQPLCRTLTIWPVDADHNNLFEPARARLIAARLAPRLSAPAGSTA